MTTARQKITYVGGKTREMVKYEERSFLGLIKWWRKVSAEKIGDDLEIFADWKIDKIYLNGKDITPTK